MQALRHADLDVAQGETVAITGPSGAGKSTLLHLLGLLDAPSGGRYLLAGRDVSTLTDRQRARCRGEILGFVFQSFHLIAHKTVAENVALAHVYARGRATTPAIVQASVDDAVAAVGLGHRAAAFPATLSGGERQRVAIARAMVRSPLVLFCDEPTGNLDPTATGRVLDLLTGMARDRGIAVVTVTHDDAVATRMDRRVRVLDGRTVDDATG